MNYLERHGGSKETGQPDLSESPVRENFDVLAEALAENPQALISLLGVARYVKSKEEEAVLLQQESTHDVLTGVLNRRGFFQAAEAQLSRLQPNQFVVLSYADINYFKEANDTLGHEQGDGILKLTARGLNEASGDDDTIGRIGGDEFAVLHTIEKGEQKGNQDIQAIADHLAEALHDATEAQRIQRNPKWKNVEGLGITIGQSRIYDSSSLVTIDEMLQQADTMMYEGKTRVRYRR